MFKKLFFFTTAIVCLVVFMNMTTNQNNDDKQRIRVNPKHMITEDVIGADYPHPVYQGPPIQWNMSAGKEVFSNEVYTITLQEVDPAGRTYYDLQSNSCIKYVWQDPARLKNIHACFMVDPVGTSGFPDRSVRYFFSDDTANTWLYLGTVPTPFVRSGFPALSGFSDGTAVIGSHNDHGGGPVITHLYKDSIPGEGNFKMCNPGQAIGENGIWPQLVPTSSISNATKLVFISSSQAGNAYLNRQTGFFPSCAFSGYVLEPGMETAEQYNLARGDDGRIGLAYIGNVPTDGMVIFKESTDNGVTWSAATTVWTPNYATDSLAALRSVDIVYLGTSPKVVFGVFKQDGLGGYFPFGTTKIFSWSPGINSGNPVLIDSAGPTRGTNPANVLSVMLGVTRCVIGKSADNNAIYVAYNKARTDTSAAGNAYMDVYFNYSTNGGASWPTATRTRVTNNSGPLRDNSYVAISSGVNHRAGIYHYAHLIYQQDSVPGSFLNGAAQSLARMMYARIRTNDPIGIHNISSGVPKDYALHQNYPNPFNPSTRIRFELPENGFVTLKVYDALGKQVAVLINENLSAGIKEYEYDASNLPSGIYFYTLSAGDFTGSKKMILLK